MPEHDTEKQQQKKLTDNRNRTVKIPRLLPCVSEGRKARFTEGSRMETLFTESRKRFALPPEGSTQRKILDVLFWVVLGCYLLHFQCKLIAWYPQHRSIGDVGAMLFFDAAFFAALLYSALRTLLKSVSIPAIAALSAGLTLALLLWPRVDYDWRCRAMNLFLILTAGGQKMNRILRVWLGVFLLGLLAAQLGLMTDLVRIQEKRQNYPVGYALGYIHPNNASRMLLWIAMLAWLLSRKKTLWQPVLLFGATAAVSALYTRCRTVAALGLCLVPAALFVQKSRYRPGKTVRVLLILSPVLCMLLSLLLSYAVVPLIPRFHGSVFWNMLSRFVQNNIALQEYGVHWTGRWIDFLGGISREFYGETIVLRILDNAYVPWLIRHGIPVTAVVLGANCAAIWKALRADNRELALIFLCIVIYGLMEPATMQFQYNFAFVYLFARDCGRNPDEERT